MLKTFWAVMTVWLCGLMLSVYAADSYTLADGTSVTGDILNANEVGVELRLPGDTYSGRMPWTKFSQDALQQFAQDPKIKPMVEPFLDVPATDSGAPADNVRLKAVSRLDLPARQSVIGALFSSSVGLFLLLLIYAANLYGAFEVAVCRARPVPVVMGLSAVLPVIGPAIFFLLPTMMAPGESNLASVVEEQAATAAASPSAPATGAAPAAQPGQPAQPASMPGRSAAAGRSSESTPATDPGLEGIQISAMAAAPKEAPVSQVFKRGQFTFNRRFIETKFAGFLVAPRSEADKKLDIVFKVPQGDFVALRISRVGAADLDLDIIQNGQPQTILIPFADIQEVTIKSKTA